MDIQQVFDEEYYSGPASKQRLEEFDKWVAPHLRGSVVDVGFGPGFYTVRAARIPAVRKVFAIDISFAAASKLTKTLQKEPAEVRNKVVVLVNDVDMLEKLDVQFDFALLLNVVEHLPFHKARRIVHKLSRDASKIFVRTPISDEKPTKTNPWFAKSKEVLEGLFPLDWCFKHRDSDGECYSVASKEEHAASSIPLRVYRPTNDGHPGCSFRELLDTWAELELCEVIHHKNLGVWGIDIEDVLLYDHPLLVQSEGLKWNIGLFGNTMHEGNTSFPWIFWPKHSKLVEDIDVNRHNRSILTTWVGTATTAKRSKVMQLYAPYVEHYWMGGASRPKYDFEEYLELLLKSRFGLCLPGVGPKCLRDMELMACGTVPIFTPGVSTSYHDPLIEGTHYLFAADPREVFVKAKQCSDAKWEEMSRACVKWFHRNCSPKGSFNTTMDILVEHWDLLSDKCRDWLVEANYAEVVE
jgi:SAM-dependent methyltransferase